MKDTFIIRMLSQQDWMILSTHKDSPRNSGLRGDTFN